MVLFKKKRYQNDSKKIIRDILYNAINKLLNNQKLIFSFYTNTYIKKSILN